MDAWKHLASATEKPTGVDIRSLYELGRRYVCDALFVTRFRMPYCIWANFRTPSWSQSGEMDGVPKAGKL